MPKIKGARENGGLEGFTVTEHKGTLGRNDVLYLNFGVGYKCVYIHLSELIKLCS